MDSSIKITEEQRERMNKTVTLSKEEITTLNKIKDYLTEDEINRFFPKFRDILVKVNDG